MQHTLTFQNIWFNLTIKERKLVAFEEHDNYAGGNLIIPDNVVPEHWAYDKIANRTESTRDRVVVQQFLSMHTDNGWRSVENYKQFVKPYEGAAYSIFMCDATLIVRSRALQMEPQVDNFFENEVCNLNREKIATELLMMVNQGIVDIETLGDKSFNDIVNESFTTINDEKHGES